MRIALRSNLVWSLGLTVIASLSGCEANIPKETTSTDTPEVDLGSSSSDAGPASDLKRIIILTNSASSYWDPCRAGVLDAATQLKLSEAGLTAVMEVNDGTPQGQLDKLRQYGSQSDVAAIGISPVDSANAAIVDELKKLRDRGLPIVTIDSDLDRDQFRDARYAFLGTNNAAGGVALGQCAAALSPDGGSYVTFVGRTGAQNAIERIAGFAEGAGDKFTSKDTMSDETDRTRARENVRNAIRNHPDLNTLVGIWSYNAPAIVDVVREQKVRDKFQVVVFDAEPLTIQAMKEGDVDVMVVQDPYAMGYQGVRMLAALVKKDEDVLAEMLPNHGQPDGDIYDTGLKVVVPDEKSPIKADLFMGKVTHMTLSAFQSWLDKYGLTGS